MSPKYTKNELKIHYFFSENNLFSDQKYTVFFLSDKLLLQPGDFFDEPEGCKRETAAALCKASGSRRVGKNSGAGRVKGAVSLREQRRGHASEHISAAGFGERAAAAAHAIYDAVIADIGVRAFKHHRDMRVVFAESTQQFNSIALQFIGTAAGNTVGIQQAEKFSRVRCEHGVRCPRAQQFCDMAAMQYIRVQNGWNMREGCEQSGGFFSRFSQSGAGSYRGQFFGQRCAVHKFAGHIR